MAEKLESFFGTRKRPEAEYSSQVAKIKRFLEYWMLEPGFQERCRVDRVAALAETGLQFTAEELAALDILTDTEQLAKAEQLPEEERLLPLRRYRSFIREKLQHRDLLQKELCQPQEKRFRSWRNRQMNRCWSELGGRNASIIHTPLNFELSLGCSMGCPFCGVASEKLQLVANYEENRELWRGILAYLHALLGDAAATGTCYYATEPLDNPDYEKFADDYFAETGQVAQVTTAAAWKDFERVRRFLVHAESQKQHIHRFSVLSLKIFHQIMEAFTPEELLYVELLPQFPEAPSCHFSRAGRARSYAQTQVVNSEEESGTIACISGFVVNMAEKTLRMVTPCLADAQHPTGEHIIMKEHFSDLAGFKKLVEKTIAEKMVENLDKGKILHLRPTLQYEETEDGVQFFRKEDFKLQFRETDDLPAKLYQRVLALLAKDEFTGYDLAGRLMDEGFAPAEIMFVLQKFCRAGLMLEPYEVMS